MRHGSTPNLSAMVARSHALDEAARAYAEDGGEQEEAIRSLVAMSAGEAEVLALALSYALRHESRNVGSATAQLAVALLTETLTRVRPIGDG